MDAVLTAAMRPERPEQVIVGVHVRCLSETSLGAKVLLL